MKFLKFSLLIVILYFLILGCSSGHVQLQPMSDENPVGSRGTVSFILQTDKTYKNGMGQEDFQQELFKLQGLASCDLIRTDSYVDILFTWDGEENYDHCSQIRAEEIPGPEEYFMIYTWDSEKGICVGYLNGNRIRYPGIKFEPWDIKGNAVQTALPEGPVKIKDLKVFTSFTEKDDIKKIVPGRFWGKRSEIIYRTDYPDPISRDKRKGKLIYGCALNDSERAEDWILEGPGIISYEKNRMTMRSKFPDTPEGHFNYWCPEDFPESFILEWEYEPLRDLGFNHIFFAAKGIDGEDIFDRSLPERDGTFSQYINGAFNNYFISYYAHLPGNIYGRAFGYLQKNINYYMLDHGPIAIKPGEKGFHRLCLIKDGDHIQFMVNGKVCIDFTDTDVKRYGPSLKDGKIGFRQMSAAVGAYRNFRVWELK